MRRNYISPEYYNTKVYGTYNMFEESNFFGSKMLDVEDSISIENQNLIYYQKSTNEQLDLSIESTLNSNVYSSSDDKKENHTIVYDPTQPTYQLENNTMWIIDINTSKIISNYLFATLKRYRTFEGVKNSMTLSNNVNVSIQEYISNNVTNRYKVKSISLFISYKDLRDQNILRYKNDWKPSIALDVNKFTKVQTETSFDGSSTKLIFTQEKPSSNYSFEYFFNILLEKI
jgi:hypothetical protein